MAYENIELPASNMTGDRTNSYFYCFNNGIMLVKQRGSPYSLIASFPTDRYLGDVVCTQFDGTHFWTMEKQLDGFVIQRWELVSSILRHRNVFSFTSAPGIKYDSDSFAIEYYGDELTVSANVGDTNVTVADGDIFNIGDTIILGPSNVGSFLDLQESAVVTSKIDDVLYLSTPLTRAFSSGDGVYTTRYIYIFNKYSPYDESKGSLLKLEWDTGDLYSFSSNHMFGEVKASCFYDNRITFVKGHEIVQVNPDSMNVYKHFALDNLDTDRAGIVPIEALWIHSDVVYRLQNKYVFWNGSAWDSESWGNYYNYVTSTFYTLATSVVYFVDVKADPDIIHAVAPGVPTTTSNITVTVLDQGRQPLDGRSVSMSSSIGSVVPSNGTTVSGGLFTCVYNGTSAEAEVDITAVVT
jgi:hypothetical protein